MPMLTENANVVSIDSNDSPRKGPLIQVDMLQAVEERTEELHRALALLRCIADSLHLGLDENPSTVHACTALDVAILKISQARDGLEFVELKRRAKELARVGR